MASAQKLVGVAGAALASGEPGAWLRDAGPRERELHSLLALKNGFECFESALHVFPSNGGDQSLEAWNARKLWRDAYEGMADDFLFFAEDAFGNQFAIADDQIVMFDAETGEVEVVASSLEEWARKVLADYDYMTCYPLAHSWQQKNGRLPRNHRLVAKIPFVAGGEFEVSNLYAAEAAKAMRHRGDLARQIRDLPDGASIEFKVVP